MYLIRGKMAKSVGLACNLSQISTLEKRLKEGIWLTGLEVTPRITTRTRLIPDAGDTTCNQRMKKVFQTENRWILRVPFRDAPGQHPSRLDLAV